MNILVTGAKGAIGKNLVENLKNLRDGKNRTRPNLTISEIYEYDLQSTPAELQAYCARADFVFHLAGVNRPKSTEEFMEGNYGFSNTLLETLKACGNRCPVMLSSSVQASLQGRFAGSAYGESKLAGEELFFRYSRETGAPVHVYRFPNVVGKWIRPNYNSAVATFCHAIANDLPYTVNDPSVELELVFMEDIVEELLDLLEGHPHRCSFSGLTPVPAEDGAYRYVPVTYKATLGEIVAMLKNFYAMSATLAPPAMPEQSFAKKLCAMYLSYLPKDKVCFDLKQNIDARGSFTELWKPATGGQFSLNVSNPGITKGQHWHNTKWEIFTVVSGRALIRQRRIGDDEVWEYEVSGEEPQGVYMLPGYTHSLTNLSDTESLLTLIWANEPFDPSHPDTYSEPV